MTNFGTLKTDLNLKYRLGLEHALAKADFLNVPDLVLLQAFAIFICLARRHDSPRFVWMMTGLAIRMGQALGLQRDGDNFKHLSLFEIEMRRRVWWSLCVLDVRASEDQGMENMISLGSFDTKLPLNINDADFGPETTQMPAGREAITDMTCPLVNFEISNVTRKMMVQSVKGGEPRMEEQERLLNEIDEKLNQGYLQYSLESGNIAQWVMVTIARLVMAKMTLLVYLPILFSSPSEHFSDKIRNKLLVAAIENAEYNHALNAEHACRHWRWVYQTYTHWYAIVYLLIETVRRPWSPLVERAWVALHSQWLIPTQSHMDKSLRIWVPLRKMMAKARKHRDAEFERLRSDPQAAERLEMEDQKIPVPGSPGPFPAGSNAIELFRERWRRLLVMPEGPGHDTRTPGQSGPGVTSPSVHSNYASQPSTSSIPAYNAGGSRGSMISESAIHGDSGLQTSQIPSNTSPDRSLAITPDTAYGFAMGQSVEPSHNALPAVSTTWSMGPGFVPWLGADDVDPSIDLFANVNVDAVDVNMDWDSDVNWYDWVQSAKGMVWDGGPGGNGRA